jgi:hypothetical protein
MDADEASARDGERTFVIRIGSERARELDRLAMDAKTDADKLAKEFLEAEIEARHGLSYGPSLRKYMYR